MRLAIIQDLMLPLSPRIGVNISHATPPVLVTEQCTKLVNNHECGTV